MQNQLADALRHPIVSRIRIDCPACGRVSFETNAPGVARSHHCECGHAMIRMSDPRTSEAERFRPAAVIVPITREEWQAQFDATDAEIKAAADAAQIQRIEREERRSELEFIGICVVVACLILLAIIAGGLD